MSIKLIARDLYHLIREVEELERKIKQTPLDQQAPLREQLRRAKADRDYLRRVLDGRKGR